MAQTVATESREWQLDRVAGTDHPAVVPTAGDTSGSFIELLALVNTQRVRLFDELDEMVVFGERYHGSADSTGVVPFLPDSVIQSSARTPRTKAGLIRFAGERFGDNFGRRIDRLAAALPAYGGRRLRVRSLRFALDFLAAHHNAWRLPDEVLLPASGNLQALWRSDRRRIVAQFLPDRMVWFTILQNRQPRLTGRVPPHEFAVQQGVQEAVRR